MINLLPQSFAAPEYVLLQPVVPGQQIDRPEQPRIESVPALAEIQLQPARPHATII